VKHLDGDLDLDLLILMTPLLVSLDALIVECVMAALQLSPLATLVHFEMIQRSVSEFAPSFARFNVLRFSKLTRCSYLKILNSIKYFLVPSLLVIIVRKKVFFEETDLYWKTITSYVRRAIFEINKEGEDVDPDLGRVVKILMKKYLENTRYLSSK
jgi:hypothetical protein